MAALAPRRLCGMCKGVQGTEQRRRGTQFSQSSRPPLSQGRSERPFSSAQASQARWSGSSSPSGRLSSFRSSSHASSSKSASQRPGSSTFRTFTSLFNSTSYNCRASSSANPAGLGGRTYATAAADYYKVLKVPHGATRQQIKAKFYELSKKSHPDAPGGSTAKFHDIGAAYEVLGDDLKRREYDQTLSNARYTNYQNPASSYAPYATNSRRPAGPHQAWSSSGRARPGPPPGTRPGPDPFASPSPEPGQYGGPLFGQGYQPFGKYDSRQSTSGDYGAPLFVFRFNLRNDPNTRQGKKEMEDMEKLFAAAFRDPFHPKHQELRNSAFAQAKRGQSESSLGARPPVGMGLVFWAVMFGVIVFSVKGDSGAEDRADK